MNGAAGDGWSRVCGSTVLADGGDGLRLRWRDASGAVVPAFVVRTGGAARAFVNRCAHVPVELDWMPGRFLDESGLYLVCATHGAMYDATDGRCTGGPCRGRGGLQPIPVQERDGSVWVQGSCVADPDAPSSTPA